MTIFQISRDVTGAVAYGLPTCDTNSSIQLSTDVEATLTVPTNGKYSKYQVVFGYSNGATVFVGYGTTVLTIPTSSFTASTAQINPPVRSHAAGDILRFISADTGTYVSVSFYGVP